MVAVSLLVSLLQSMGNSAVDGDLRWNAEVAVKSLNLNQIHFNPITCPHTTLFPRSAPCNPTILTTLPLYVCWEHVACIHNVEYTYVLYVRECLLCLCGIRLNTLSIMIDTGAFVHNSTCVRFGLVLLYKRRPVSIMFGLGL